MGVLYRIFLDGDQVFACRKCHTHLSLSMHIMSKNFKGRYGDAYLFGNVVNIKRAEPEERRMITGKYLVQDISCCDCESNLGWTYMKSYNEQETYKEGKFILEVNKMVEL